jgi:PAS domain S-box-containing protein
MADSERVNILLVDDQPAKLLTYEAILKELDATLIKASTAQAAFDYLLRNEIAVILIDVFMPELDGFQLASMVRDHPRFERTPIIFISAIYLSDIDRLRGYENGAVDYVPVPVVPEILRAKVKVFVELFRKTRELKRLNHELEDRVQERTAALNASHERLQESEERLRLASEAADFGTYDCDPTTGNVLCSPQMKRLIGWEGSDELSVDDFLELVSEPDRASVRRVLLPAGQSADDRHRVEFRVRHDGGFKWLLDCGRAFFEQEAKDKPIRVMGTVLDITERKQTEERQLLLMAELDHRVKNILANISAIAKLSSKSSTSVAEFVRALDARIHAVSTAHSLLRRDSWDGIDLRTYLQEVLSPFIGRHSTNLKLEGSTIQLSPKAAQSLALVFHELATNAAKYGALSTQSGHVILSWRSYEGGHVKLTWQEHGGPKVVVPTRTGFGTMAIKALASELGGDVSYVFDADGVVFSIAGPIEQVGRAQPNAVRPLPKTPPSTVPHGRNPRLSILLVEDELLVGLQAKSDLEAAGHKIAGLATNIEQGLEFAERLAFDFALLDIRLGDELSVPIAELLMRKNIPFFFVTGFEDESILPEYLQAIPRLTKPYEVNKILLAINAEYAEVEGAAALRCA